MLFVVPIGNVAVSELTIDLDYWLPLLGKKTVSLTLPKFKVDTTIDATQSLRAIGLRSLFEPGAFESISRNAVVDQISQRVVVDVDEKGSTAAVVTNVHLMIRAAKVQPIQVVIDKPFLFFLRDRDTGRILIAGYIHEP